MFQIRPKNRKAISAVLTTIIILVASIVLGTGVVVFSTGLFQTGGQQQAVQIVGMKAWVSNNQTQGYSWGAFAIKNTGDKLLSVNSITLRSTSIPFGNWYADTNSSHVSVNFQSQFISTGIAGSTGNMQSNTANLYGTATCTTSTNPILINENVPADITGQAFAANELCLQPQIGPIALTPGASAIVYFKNPTGLYGTTDQGVTSTIGILAGSAPTAQTVRLATS
jgi:hypothetical protein